VTPPLLTSRILEHLIHTPGTIAEAIRLFMASAVDTAHSRQYVCNRVLHNARLLAPARRGRSDAGGQGDVV
jgi:hypothetical protein